MSLGEGAPVAGTGELERHEGQLSEEGDELGHGIGRGELHAEPPRSRQCGRGVACELRERHDARGRARLLTRVAPPYIRAQLHAA